MNERKYYGAIGTFVLFGFLSLMILAFRMSSGGSFLTTDATYHVVTEFTNIGRLKPQAKVAIAGVTVGRVSHIALDRETFHAIVTLELLKKYDDIPEDSRFSIVTAGLLGDNYVICYPGFATAPLQEGSAVDTSQTTSALVLEELIAKMLTSFAGTGPRNSAPKVEQESV